MKSTAIAMMVGLVVVCGAGSADAQTDVRGGVAGKLSSLGAGVDVAAAVGDRVNVRVGFATLSLNHDFDRDGIALAATLKLRSVSGMIDWFPFAGSFHLSPGVMLYNGNKVEAVARVPGGRQFTLSSTDLLSNPASPVSGTADVSFDRAAPMFVVGWGNIAARGSRRWSIPVELGAAFTRAPKAVLSLSGSACQSNGANCRNVATDPTLQSLVAQEQADLNDDIKFFRIIPVLSVGFGYRF